MDAGLMRCDDWSARPVRSPAPPASAEAEYFRRRAAQEQRAALQSRDVRVRRVHLEMALRYRALLREAEAGRGAELRLRLRVDSGRAEGR